MAENTGFNLSFFAPAICSFIISKVLTVRRGRRQFGKLLQSKGNEGINFQGKCQYVNFCLEGGHIAKGEGGGCICIDRYGHSDGLHLLNSEHETYSC